MSPRAVLVLLMVGSLLAAGLAAWATVTGFVLQAGPLLALAVLLAGLAWFGPWRR